MGSNSSYLQCVEEIYALRAARLYYKEQPGAAVFRQKSKARPKEQAACIETQPDVFLPVRLRREKRN